MKRLTGEACGGAVAIRGLSKITLVAVALLVQEIACGGSAISGSGQSPSEGSSAPDANVQPTSLTVHGLVRGPNGTVVPGARVCLEHGTSEWTYPPVSCSSSGPDGSFALSDSEPAASATLTLRATGFLPMLYPFIAQPGDVSVAPTETTLVEDRGTFLGVATDPNKGQVPFVMTVSGSMFAPGITATATILDILTGFAGPGVSAVYEDPDGSAAPGATSGAAGAFVNLSPGLYAMTFQFTEGVCAAGIGMPGSPAGMTSASSVFYAVVRAGYVMAPIVVSCFVP